MNTNLQAFQPIIIKRDPNKKLPKQGELFDYKKAVTIEVVLLWWKPMWIF
jgi:hypothetical protein